MRSIENRQGKPNTDITELETTLNLLIKQKKKNHLPDKEMEEMKNVLERCADKALGDYGALSEGTLYELLQNADIFDATDAIKKDFNNASVSGSLLRNLWISLGNAW